MINYLNNSVYAMVFTQARFVNAFGKNHCNFKALLHNQTTFEIQLVLFAI
jgi:hypothetical protein